MIYYQMVNINNFTKESLENFLLRRETSNAGFYTCREVLNRALQDSRKNLIVAGEEPPKENVFFDCKEVLGNRANIERLLQEILDRNLLSTQVKVTVGNRFFFWSKATTMRSPLGSLISGILKLVIKFPCVETDYDKFKTEIIKVAVNAGSYLSEYTTNSSLAIAIKLFSEYYMPDDPRTGYSAMGTNQYLQNINGTLSNALENDREKLYEYFLKVGIKESTIIYLFRKGKAVC